MKKIASFSVCLVCLFLLPALVANDDHKAGERMVLKIKDVEYAFRWCPPGKFTMGSPANERGRFDDETQHQVALTRGFWMLETEVTQGMWESAMGNNPSEFKGAKLPVECVSWNGCQEFVEELNKLKVAPSGFNFSLPTEAQWEYACRAGTTTALNSGRNLSLWDIACLDLGELGWFGCQDEGKATTYAVGQKKPNAWGLYDMHGNVYEWCLDWYGDYPSSAVTDPVGASDGSKRVIRSGCWCLDAEFCRSACRRHENPSLRDCYTGVRISLVRAE